MPTLGATTRVAASPAEVWRVLSATENWGEWATFRVVSRGELAGGEPVTIGFRLGPIPIAAGCRFTRVEPGASLWWRGGLPWVLDVHHGFDLEPDEAGTRVIHTEHFRGAFGWLFALVVWLGPDNYQRTNRALASRVEAHVGARV